MSSHNDGMMVGENQTTKTPWSDTADARVDAGQSDGATSKPFEAALPPAKAPGEMDNDGDRRREVDAMHENEGGIDEESSGPGPADDKGHGAFGAQDVGGAGADESLDKSESKKRLVGPSYGDGGAGNETPKRSSMVDDDTLGVDDVDTLMLDDEQTLELSLAELVEETLTEMGNPACDEGTIYSVLIDCGGLTGFMVRNESTHHCRVCVKFDCAVAFVHGTLRAKSAGRA